MPLAAVRSRPRPFIDTNVLFSGLYSAAGPPAAILQAHTQGRLVMVISRQVMQELITTIGNKQPRLLPLLQSFLANAPPEVCADPTPADVEHCQAWINPSDAPILAAAIASHADCLVTGNTRHFTPDVAQRAEIRILTPAAYRSAHLP